MAFTEFFVQTTGSNLNAGSTNADAASITTTNGAYAQGAGAGGTDRFTAAAGTPFSGINGADVTAGLIWVSSYPDGSGGPTGFVARVTAVNAGGASIDIHLTAIAGTRPTTAANGRTAKIGGAWAGPTGATAFPIGFAATVLRDAADDPCCVNIKGGVDYTATAGWTHALNGYVRFEGYTTTPHDGGKAKIVGPATGNAISVVVCTGTGVEWKSLWFFRNGDATGTASTGLLDIQAANCVVNSCLFTGAWRFGLRMAGAGVVIDCEGYGNNIDDANLFGNFGALEESIWIRCWSHHCDTAPGGDCEGMVLGSDNLEPVAVINCIFSDNASCGVISSGSHVNVAFVGCTFANNGESGIDISSLTATTRSIVLVQNCMFSGNNQYGVEFDAAAVGFPRLINNAFFDNTLGETNNVNPSFISGSITLSADPFTDGANGNFELNTTAGGGADARNAGIGSFPNDGVEYSDTTVSFPDVGAAQHDDAGGGGQTSYTFGG